MSRRLGVLVTKRRTTAICAALDRDIEQLFEQRADVH